MKRKKNKQKNRKQNIKIKILNIIFVAILHLLDNDNGERQETGDREGVWHATTVWLEPNQCIQVALHCNHLVIYIKPAQLRQKKKANDGINSMKISAQRKCYKTKSANKQRNDE